MSERFESGCLETPMVLDHSLVRMNLQLRSQSHIAHQSRREKLRAQHNPFSPETAGNQNDTSAFSDFPLHETSPSIPNKAEQARQANETSSSATGYPAHPTNTEMGDEMQAYDAHIMTSEMQNFPSGIELLGFSSKNSFLQQTSGGDVSASRPSMIGTSYQSPENPNSTVGNWKSLSGLQSRSNSAWASSTVAPNSIQGLDHNGGYGGQNLSNPLVVAGGGLHIRSSRDELKGDIEAHASHAQAGAMQLYLANPKYPSGYPETPTSANMIVTHPTNGIDAQGLETHEKHLVEVPLHFSTFSHNALPLVSEVNTSTQTARESNQIQWQSGGIGLPGSGNNMQHHNQFVFPQLINNTMSWNNRSGGSQSIHVPWSRGPFVETKGVDALVRSHDCMSTGPDRSGQGLSLSLSSHQSSEMHLQDIANHANVLQMGGEVKAKSGDLLNGTQGNTDGFGYFPSYSRDGSPGKGILNSFQAGRPTMNMNGVSPMFAANNASDLKNSRYLKAAQELLYEFCNVGRGNRPNNAKQKISKTQEWDGRPSMGYNVVHCGSSTRSEVAGNFESGSMDLPLYSGDRFELQRRKAKLVSMLEEVGRRYKYYCDQMHLVVTSFESVTCVGAAAPYTALALEAMSKHFRCLKDAIIGQLQVTSKVLGEKNSIVPGTTRGETPRLGFLDRTIRQQRAFQQLGMMEQHPWRPQRGLPERSVSVLRAWLFEHFLHPYPTDADKHILAKQTGLSRSQVSNWFINARVRLWKPMVEEMYVEETKEDKMEVTPPKGEQNEEQEKFERVTGTSSHEKNVYEHGGPDHNQTASEEVTFKLDHSCSTSQTAQESSGGKTLHLQSQQKIDDMKEVEMNLIHESESLTSMNTSEADMRLEEAPGYKNNFDEEKRFRNDQFFLNKLQAIDHTDTTLDFSSYNNNASTVTYSHEDLTPRQFASNGVSLTLGLRHSGGLPFPMVEQKYSNTLYFTREQEDDDPNNRYNMLANQENQGNGFILDQNLPYRNYANGSRLLHDFVG